MGGFIILAALLFPFIMPLMWRRMKRVQAQVNAGREEAPSEQPWEEPLETRDGLVLQRTSNPNDELIALGERARQSRWAINND